MATMMCSTVAVSADFTHFPPKGLGSVHTYTVWDKINWGGDCKKLINFVKSNGALYDAYGIVTYGGYFAGATTSTLGKVGDMLLVVQEDGILYPVIVSDIKNKMEVLNVKKEIANLKRMEAKLDKLLSEDKKTELELNDIAALLG